jgi:hypothetical protein
VRPGRLERYAEAFREMPSLGGAAIGLVEKPLYALGLRQPLDLPLPDFLGIGAQKSGTTWLYANLRCHPELYLSDEKEVHYFDKHFIHPLRSYSSRFAGVEKLKGEITPGYGILPRRRIAFIHTIMPELKLLFLMRDPVDRAWSHALMVLAKRRGLQPDEVKADELLTHFRRRASRNRGDYLQCIDRWLEHYDDDRLFVGLFDDILERPRELLVNVFRHLGVSTDVDWSQFPFDQQFFSASGGSPPDHLKAALREIYRDEIERLVARFGDRIAHWRG